MSWNRENNNLLLFLELQQITNILPVVGNSASHYYSWATALWSYDCGVPLFAEGYVETRKKQRKLYSLSWLLMYYLKHPRKRRTSVIKLTNTGNLIDIKNKARLIVFLMWSQITFKSVSLTWKLIAKHTLGLKYYFVFHFFHFFYITSMHKLKERRYK